MGAILSGETKLATIPYLRENFNKISQREMARQLGIGNTTINAWCKEQGLYFKKHTVNENFFDTWNEESAYILGYIFTDGNIQWNTEKVYQALTITAAAKDVAHLERVRNIIGSTKPLLYAEKTKSYRMIANSKQLSLKLMKIGVVPAKSLIVEFPEIPKEYLGHFIRGVVDGGGTVRYLNRKRSPYFHVTVCSGSRKFLEKMVSSIKDSIGIDANVRHHGGNTYVVQYSCKRGMTLAKWIYTDSTLFLNRKFEQYQTALRAKEVVLSL